MYVRAHARIEYQKFVSLQQKIGALYGQVYFSHWGTVFWCRGTRICISTAKNWCSTLHLPLNLRKHFGILSSVESRKVCEMSYSKATIDTSGMTMFRVVLALPSGASSSHEMSYPLHVPAGSYSPYSVCRMAVSRLKMKELEKVLLCMLLDDAEYRITSGYSYEELSSCLGKCVHSVEAAMSSLRRMGFVVTSRIGRDKARVSVSMEAFVMWAVSSLQYPEAEENKPSKQDSRNDTVNEPAAKKEEQESSSSMDMAAPYDGEFDASLEREDTLRAAGRERIENPDEDDISFGSETADTDIGHGVRMNTNI